MVKNIKNINELERFFSSGRLAIPRKKSKSKADALEYHQATIDLGLSVMSIIGAVEISLRNLIVEKMDAHFGNGKWLISEPGGFYWEQTEKDLIEDATEKAYKKAKKRLTKKQFDGIRNDLRIKTEGMSAEEKNALWPEIRPIIYTDGDLISSFTMYFWKQIYIEQYETALWKPVLQHTFPGKRVGPGHDADIDRRTVYGHLDIVHTARNRMAHYEPVLGGRFTATMDSIKLITHHLGTDRPGHGAPLASFLASRIADVEAFEKNLR